jgi:hypothetical protein
MLEHLRQRVAQTLAGTASLTLSTQGPAGLQSGHFECELVGICLFILVPHTSDHLFNLETNPDIVAVNRHWNLRGLARPVLPDMAPPQLRLLRTPEAGWSTLVEIRPRRVNILGESPSGYSETIDIDDDDHCQLPELAGDGDAS